MRQRILGRKAQGGEAAISYILIAAAMTISIAATVFILGEDLNSVYGMIGFSR